MDLWPYVAVRGGTAHVLPAALSRFAAAPGELLVNCSQGGGVKDVWVR